MSDAALFQNAADTLLSPSGNPDPRTMQLLEALNYRWSRGGEEEDTAVRELREHRAALLRVAARFERIFQLDAALAPGLVFLGGELLAMEADSPTATGARISVTGKGVTFQEAFESCVGEAVEYLSQVEIEDEQLEQSQEGDALSTLDQVSRRYIEHLLASHRVANRPISWVVVKRLSDGANALLPADICLRRRDARWAFALPFLLGTGTAAGASLDQATLHGITELIERDALALWWKGGRRGRALWLEDEGLREAADLLARLRQGNDGRRTWLLDVTTELGVPCAVAISCLPGGERFAFGAAARMSMVAAAKAALLEACQLELAYDIVATKIRESGEAALNATDRGHLMRATSIDAERCQLLTGTASPTQTPDCEFSLVDLAARCAALGIEIYALNITRPELGVPAMRIVAPALQLEPSELMSERLQLVIARTGGGYKFTNGVRLL
jgi:ribosomal protein S12 methylthiotransferase accessory factor